MSRHRSAAVLLCAALLIAITAAGRSAGQSAGQPASQPADRQAARALIETAIERMGGHAAFDAVIGLEIESDGVQYHVMDAERPEPPFQPDYFHTVEQVDYRLPALRRRFASGSDPLYGNHQDAVYTPAGATAINQRAGKTVARRLPASRHWLLQDPIAVLRAALAASDLVKVEDRHLEAIGNSIVRFAAGDSRVRLFFDGATGYLRASEIITTETWDAVWDLADVQLLTKYSSWDLQPGGLHMPMQWDVSFDHLPFQMRSLTKVTVNPRFDSATFQPLAGPDVPLAVQVDDLAPGGADRPIVEVAPGILQVTPGPQPGNFSTLLVDQGDGVVIVETPTSSGWSAAVLAEAERRFPGKPVKAAVTTDCIWWHFAGVREYAAHGIPTYVLDQNAAIIRQVTTARRTLNPDTRERHQRGPNLVQVGDPIELGSGPNRLLLLPLRTASIQVMVAYFPERRLLYSADLAGTRGPGGPFVNPEAIWQLRGEVHSHGLAVDTLIGIHLLPTPWAKLEEQVSHFLAGRATP